MLNAKVDGHSIICRECCANQTEVFDISSTSIHDPAPRVGLFGNDCHWSGRAA